MSTIKSVYKRYNGSSWDIVYFKTSYDQVGVDATTRFLKPSTHTVNGKSFYNSGDQGITLYAGDIKISSSDNTTIASKLEALQTLDADLTAIAGLTGTSGFLKKTAANTWALDTTVLTSGNYSSTLGSVYQPLHANLTSIAGLSTSSTGLIKMTNGVASLDTNTYATTSSVASRVSSSNTLADGKIVVGDGGTRNVKTTSYSVSDIVDIAEGKSASYSSYAYYDGEKYYIAVGNSTQSSGTAVTASGITKLEITGSTIALSSYQYLYKISDSETIIGNIKLSDTKNGDIFLIVQTELPDFWIAIDGSSYDLQILETTKVDLSNYVTNVSYDSSSHKIQKTIDGSTTDVVDLDNFASLNNSTGAITIGGVFKTPLYSHQTMYYRAIKVAGTEKIGNTTSTALDFLNSGNVQFTYNNGLYASVDLSGYVPTSRTVNGHALSSNVTVTRSDVDANKVYYGTTSPSSMITNDIWIDTNNTV